MGNKTGKAKQIHLEILTKYTALSELKVNRDLTHSLPFGELKSRLCIAIILGHLARKKQVIKLMLILNKSSRAFIITQDGLPGFLIPNHDNKQSFFFELENYADFRNELGCHLNQEKHTNVLSKCTSLEDKERTLRLVYPIAFAFYIKAFGKEKEKELMNFGVVTLLNYTWYIQSELLPRLNKLMREGKIRDKQKTKLHLGEVEYKYKG